MPAGLSPQITDLALHPDIAYLDFEQVFHTPDKAGDTESLGHVITFHAAEHSGNMNLLLLDS